MTRIAATVLARSPLRWLIEIADSIDGAWDVHDPFLSGDDGGNPSQGEAGVVVPVGK